MEEEKEIEYIVCDSCNHKYLKDKKEIHDLLWHIPYDREKNYFNYSYGIDDY